MRQGTLRHTGTHKGSSLSQTASHADGELVGSAANEGIGKAGSFAPGCHQRMREPSSCLCLSPQLIDSQHRGREHAAAKVTASTHQTCCQPVMHSALRARPALWQPNLYLTPHPEVLLSARCAGCCSKLPCLGCHQAEHTLSIRDRILLRCRWQETVAQGAHAHSTG